jgi:hypothetical protein
MRFQPERDGSSWHLPPSPDRSANGSITPEADELAAALLTQVELPLPQIGGGGRGEAIRTPVINDACLDVAG